MGTLTVWTFDTSEGAGEAGALLQQLAAGVAGLQDGATVSWPDATGPPRSGQLPGLATEDALGTAFWGLLLGLVFYVPLLGAAVGAATGAVSGVLDDVGIDDTFVNRVRDRVTPGTSALLVMSSDTAVDHLRDVVGRVTPAGVVSVVLGPDEHAALLRVFRG